MQSSFLNSSSSPEWNDPLWSRVALPYARVAQCLGFTVGIRTNDPRVLGLFESAFGPDVSVTGAPDLDLAVTADCEPAARARPAAPGTSQTAQANNLDEPDRPDTAPHAQRGDPDSNTQDRTHGATTLRPPGPEDSSDRSRMPAGDSRAPGVSSSQHHESEHPATRSDALPATPHAPGASFHRERNGLFVAGDDRGSVVSLDLVAGRGAAFVSTATPPFVIRQVLLESPVWRLATARGLVALHAATVVVDGVGLLLRGAAGSGKSTLAAAMLRAGHRVTSDEVTWWDPRGNRPVLRGGARWIHVEPRSAQDFDRFRDRPDHPEGPPEDGTVVDVRGIDALGVDVRGVAPGKRALEIPSDLAAPVVEFGRLILLQPPAGGWTQHYAAADASIRELTADAARDGFDALRIRGEGSQEPRCFDRARDDLCRDGAMELKLGSVPANVACLEQIAQQVRKARA